MEELELLTVKQLQDKLVELGMPEEDAVTMKTKASAIVSIKTLMAKSAVVENPDKPEEVKVKSIEEKPNPSEEREVNKKWKSKAERMREKLLAQETVSILIPLEPGEKVGVVEWRTGKDGGKYQVRISGAVESVQPNGYKYLIPKGIYTPVPKQVADIIGTAQQTTLRAGEDKLLDRTDPNTGRPMNEVL